MKIETLIGFGSLIVAGYVVYKKYLEKEDPVKLSQDLSRRDPTGGTQTSKLDPTKLDFPVEGGIYRIDPTDLSPFERFAVSRGYYSITREGKLRTDIPFIPFI